MNGITQQLASGQLSVAAIIVWTFPAFVLSVAAGAAADMKLGGKDLATALRIDGRPVRPGSSDA
jgi:hypothetical protein